MNSIRDILNERSQRKFRNESTNELDAALMEALEALPEHKPEYPTYIAGRRLQSVIGDTARYVPTGQFDASKFIYAPTQKSVRLGREMKKSAAVLAAIKVLEANNETASEVVDDIETLEDLNP